MSLGKIFAITLAAIVLAATAFLAYNAAQPAKASVANGANAPLEQRKDESNTGSGTNLGSYYQFRRQEWAAYQRMQDSIAAGATAAAVKQKLDRNDTTVQHPAGIPWQSQYPGPVRVYPDSQMSQPVGAQWQSQYPGPVRVYPDSQAARPTPQWRGPRHTGH